MRTWKGVLGVLGVLVLFKGATVVQEGEWFPMLDDAAVTRTAKINHELRPMLETASTKHAATKPELPYACRAFMTNNHTLSLKHGRYVQVPGRKPPYDHNSCFLMKPRYNCATNDPALPKAYEFKFILQSDIHNDSTICDVGAIVNDLGGPTAISAKVGIFGNSYLRQVFQALACKYQDHLTRVRGLENPPDVSLAGVEKRGGRPYNMTEYGRIITVPLAQRPIPLCAGKPASYPKYFHPGVNLTTPHLGVENCVDDLAMLEFGNSLQVYYNFRPYTLEDTSLFYNKLLGLNVSDLDYIAFNNNERKKSFPHNSNPEWHDFESLLPALQKIQLRDAHQWFGARNPWIDHPPDNHPCMPGVPDDEVSLLLFAVMFGVRQFSL